MHRRASDQCIGMDLGSNSTKGGFYSGVSSRKSVSACELCPANKEFDFVATDSACLGFCIRNARHSTRLMHSDLNQNAAAARGLLTENVPQRLREEIPAARTSPGEKIDQGKRAREDGDAQISVPAALTILA